MMHSPASDCFPVYPATWYLFCAARDLRDGPLSKTILGRRLVAFRNGRGRVAVLESRCAHMAADLGRGRVVGDAIQCPFHGWEYLADGRCISVPGMTEIPEFARQTSYPVVERHGFVFFFNGPEPLFGLPFFFDARPDDFVAGKPFRFAGDLSWYMLVANGFDTQHFQAVHDRRLCDPPEVDCPAPLARRMRVRWEVTGNSIFDRLLRWFVGHEVKVSITSWGGPLVLVTGSFRRAQSYIWIAAQPSEENQSVVEVIVFAPRRPNGLARLLLQPLSLWLRRLFTRGFMKNDIDRLPGVRYQPHCLTAGDRHLIDYFQWLTTLPRGLEEKACPATEESRSVPGDNGSFCKKNSS
jgi:nitrite reductase/ring-hydroxylating ferredoxin subunit